MTNVVVAEDYVVPEEVIFEVYYLHPVHSDWWIKYNETIWDIDHAKAMADSIAVGLNTKTEIVRVKIARKVMDKEEIRTELLRA